MGGGTPDDVVGGGGGGVGGGGASAAAVAEIVLAGRGGGKRGGLGLLTTNSPISPFVGSLVEDLGAVRVRSGGAGNKMMMLLERSIYGGCDDGDGGGPMLYIQDRGVSRWDTCAAEGVLEAHGGRLTILQVPRRPDQSRFRTRPCMPDEEQSTPTERGGRRRPSRPEGARRRRGECVLEFVRICRPREGVEYGRGEDVRRGGDTEGRRAESALFQLKWHSLPYLCYHDIFATESYLFSLAGRFDSTQNLLGNHVLEFAWSSPRPGHSNPECSGNEREGFQPQPSTHE